MFPLYRVYTLGSRCMQSAYLSDSIIGEMAYLSDSIIEGIAY